MHLWMRVALLLESMNNVSGFSSTIFINRGLLSATGAV